MRKSLVVMLLSACSLDFRGPLTQDFTVGLPKGSACDPYKVVQANVSGTVTITGMGVEGNDLYVVQPPSLLSDVGGLFKLPKYGGAVTSLGWVKDFSPQPTGAAWRSEDDSLFVLDPGMSTPRKVATLSLDRKNITDLLLSTDYIYYTEFFVVDGVGRVGPFTRKRIARAGGQPSDFLIETEVANRESSDRFTVGAWRLDGGSIYAVACKGLSFEGACALYARAESDGVFEQKSSNFQCGIFDSLTLAFDADAVYVNCDEGITRVPKSGDAVTRLTNTGNPAPHNGQVELIEVIGAMAVDDRAVYFVDGQTKAGAVVTTVNKVSKSGGDVTTLADVTLQRNDTQGALQFSLSSLFFMTYDSVTVIPLCQD